jgi:hypothetical protein
VYAYEQFFGSWKKAVEAIETEPNYEDKNNNKTGKRIAIVTFGWPMDAL